MIKKVTQITDVKELFSIFIQDKFAKGLSQKTCDNYAQCFNQFMLDNPNIVSIEQIKKNTLSSWSLMLKRRMNSVYSVNHYIGDVRVFLYWCMENEYLKRFKIELMKGQEEKIKCFSDDELKRLLIRPKENADFVEWRFSFLQ